MDITSSITLTRDLLRKIYAARRRSVQQNTCDVSCVLCRVIDTGLETLVTTSVKVSHIALIWHT